MTDHFFLQLNWQDLEKPGSQERVIKKLQLPENKFPPKFLVKGKDYLVGGYFVSYYPKVTLDQLVALCQKHKWQEIANFNADFLIIYFDSNKRRVLVLTDQTGKFPCYFYLKDNTLTFSTSLNEIIKTLNSPTLNLEKSMEFIFRDTRVSDNTIIKDIFLLFPGSLGEFSSDGNCKVHPLLNVEKFLNTPFKSYSTLEELSDIFLETLEVLVRERFEALDGFKFCSEISSGFDSPLICYLLKKNTSKPFTCYSQIAKDAYGDTHPDIVADFARKHGLKIKFVPYDKYFPFSTDDDLEWIKQGPSFIQKSQVYNYFLTLKKEGNIARFTGEGGDEAYWSNDESLKLKLKFPIQKQYFDYQALKRYGINEVLSDKGVELLLDKERFRQKNNYPLLIPHSAVNLFIILFPLSWETGIWPLTPFADNRLIQITRSIPKMGKEANIKQRMWQRRKDIFTVSQFRKKEGTGEHYARYLEDKSEFIISVLKNSLLGEKGWVKSSEIIDDFLKGKVKKYYEGDRSTYLTNLVELEYFIQQNNIKVN